MDVLHKIDRELFTFLNSYYHSPTLDAVMQFLTGAMVWWVAFGVIVAYCLYRRNWKSLQLTAVLLVSVIIADVLTFRVLKPAFGRTRPCYQHATRMIMPSCGSEFGMPSNHAANAMAAATVVSLAYPIVAPAAVFVAFLVGLSRIYVGVHYPFDVMAGFLVGMLSAAIAFTLFQMLLRRQERLKT